MGYTNVLSLCSGGGGLERGLQLALKNARTICYVEREAFCAEYLAEQAEKNLMDGAPIYTDLRTFQGRPWRGVVDCITAGYPCQPFSHAGKRGGHNDPRHLWPQIARIIREVSPAFVFLENVPGHFTIGAEDVANELVNMGYSVALGLFTAAEIKANHKRERLFFMGIVDDPNQPRSLRRFLESKARKKSKNIIKAFNTSPSIHLFPPRPRHNTWKSVPKCLYPALSKDDFVAYGLANNIKDWIRMLGNGVVPLQAAYAFCTLWSVIRFGEKIEE